MILYHGSTIPVPKPDLTHSRKAVDFGPGFYLTPLRQQAVDWCARFTRVGKDGYVSEYSFDETAFAVLKTLRFDSYSDAWLDFVLSCRSGKDTSDYDIVSGGIANDKVFNTVQLYFSDLIDRDEAIKRLRYERPNMQVCLRTQAALSYLRFTGSEKV